MTHKRMMATIKENLAAEGVECDAETKAAVESAVDSTLNYVLEFAQEVSQELVGVGLYSEAMVAGVFVRKLKTLRSDPKN